MRFKKENDYVVFFLNCICVLDIIKIKVFDVLLDLLVIGCFKVIYEVV